MQQNTGSETATSIVNQSRMMSPEEIAVQSQEQAAFLVYPEMNQLFLDRENRLRTLADNHPMREYMLFVADLTHAQHVALSQYAQFEVPSIADIHAAIDQSMPLLNVFTHKRDPAWVKVLRAMLASVQGKNLHLPVAPVIQQVLDKKDGDIEKMADRLINGYLTGLDLAQAQLIAAGLQVYFTSLLVGTREAYQNRKPEPFGKLYGNSSHCPCCGSRPVASITRIGAQESGFRYVSCSMCSAQWHVVRIKCVACDNTKDIVYESLQAIDEESSDLGSPHSRAGAVQVECCDSCGHYLKIVHMEKDQFVEPHADDLASVALDLLVAEQGPVRFGNNLMLLFGLPEEPDNPGVH
jgi:FdhE protein